MFRACWRLCGTVVGLILVLEGQRGCRACATVRGKRRLGVAGVGFVVLWGKVPPPLFAASLTKEAASGHIGEIDSLFSGDGAVTVIVRKCRRCCTSNRNRGALLRIPRSVVVPGPSWSPLGCPRDRPI